MEENPQMEARVRMNPLEDLRNSFDVRNSRSGLKSMNRMSFADKSVSDNLLTKSSANFSDLKLTSLRERRSITRGLKAQKFSKAEGNSLTNYAKANKDAEE